MVVQLFVEFLSGARRNLKSFSILYQLDHVARTIQDGGAMSAISKMRSHAGSQGSIHLAFKIIGNLLPHFHAIDFDRLFRQVSCSRPDYGPALSDAPG